MKKSWSALMVLAALTAMAACSTVPREAQPPAGAAAAPAAAASSQKVQLLFVQNAAGVTLKKNTLTLQGVSPATIFFTDRPDRITGHMRTPHFVSLWKGGKDSFSADPPNATLSVFTKNKVRDMIVELSNPRLKGDALTYDIKMLHGRTLAQGGPCSLFIDALAEPLTQDSYPGVDRRMYRRGDDGTISNAADDEDSSDDDSSDHVWKEEDEDTANDHVWKEKGEDNDLEWNKSK